MLRVFGCGAPFFSVSLNEGLGGRGCLKDDAAGLTEDLEIPQFFSSNLVSTGRGRCRTSTRSAVGAAGGMASVSIHRSALKISLPELCRSFHPLLQLRMMFGFSSLCLRYSRAGISWFYVACRTSKLTLCSRQSPMLCHHRKQLSLWSLASIVKGKGA